MKRLLLALPVLLLGCTSGDDSAEPGSARLADASFHALPDAATTADADDIVTFIDRDGAFATVDRETGEVIHGRRDWSTRTSFDGTYAVSTTVVRPGDTKVVWDALDDAGAPVIGGAMITGTELEPTATQLDGHLAALVTPSEPVEGAIAGARSMSTIVLADPSGERWRTTLEGNFEPEAFGRRLGADGLPAQVFLLEYFPADAPRYYRVRVLSTETGDLSLPLNLRDKSNTVDEQMAGFSRQQIVADEHGLLFTLYRGTIDGTPDGEPYGFIHTLDFADGVWCLFIDPTLQLDTLDGTIAVGGDTLYVASSNGHVGAFDIPSISDIQVNPTMRWTTQVHFGTDAAPAMIADGDGALVGYGDEHLIRVAADSSIGRPTSLPGPAPTALTRDDLGVLHAAGSDWTTVGVDAPPWLGHVQQLIVS